MSPGIKKIAALSLAFLLWQASDAAVLSAENEKIQKISEFIHQQMVQYTSTNNVPNAVAALVTADSIYLLKGYGYADMEKTEPVDPDYHLFRVGSVSKIFTWTAIMQLYEQGLVDLDADITRYTGTRFNHRILYRDKDAKPITLRHLLSHTAGYEDVLEGLFSFRPQPSLEEQLLRRVPARIFPPGEVMAYSNWGTTLSGYIVEQATGMRFEDYVREHIFLPLGMKNTSFEQPLEAALQKQMVTASRWVEGAFHKGQFEHMPAPAGGLSVSAYDMALLLQAHLSGGNNYHGQILKESTMELMHTPLYKYHPLLAGMTHGLMETYVNGNRIISHSGSSTLFDSGFYIFPEEGIGLFFAFSGGNTSGHVNILHGVASEFFPSKETEVKNYKPLMKVRIEDIQGEYHQSRSMRTSSNKILNLIMGNLHLKQTGNDHLAFNLYEMDFSYSEVMPGLYKSNKVNKDYPFGFMEYLLVTKAPDGRMMLVTDGPMSFIRARWYERASFAGLLFIPALILAFTNLMFFGIRSIWIRFSKNVKLMHGMLLNGNRLIIAHAGVLMATIFIFLANSSPHPVHRLPYSFFDPNPLMEGLISGGLFMTTLLGVVLIASAVRVWIKHPGFIIAKVSQTVYALGAVALTWLLYFYNLTGF